MLAGSPIPDDISDKEYDCNWSDENEEDHEYEIEETSSEEEEEDGSGEVILDDEGGLGTSERAPDEGPSGSSSAHVDSERELIKS